MDGENRVPGFRRTEFEPRFASAWFHELEKVTWSMLFQFLFPCV